MFENIRFLAGPKAYRTIRQEGLEPSTVSIVAGAAGGPKALALSALDESLATEWFAGRRAPLFLIGSSIGAWRFAAMAQQQPGKALRRFRELYIGQRYDRHPSPQEVTAASFNIQRGYIEKNAPGEILRHPIFRTSIIAARCRGIAAFDNRIVQTGSLVLAALMNRINRKCLRILFDRALFHDPRDLPPFFNMTDFPSLSSSLTEENFMDVLLASGSIPLIMSGVASINGAPRGTYRDGGIIDYHLDLPFSPPKGTIVLFPHYTHIITPGWFDKNIPARKPRREHMEQVLLAAPSRIFLERLPLKRVPDRQDFTLFRDRDDERRRLWSIVIEEGGRLRDAFLEAVRSGRIADLVEPLFPE